MQALLAALALGTAVVYLAKRSGNRSSNRFFALLLASFALSICYLVLEHLSLLQRYPDLRYVPLWFTWTIGPAWFFYVKFTLFPAYRWRWTDAKHFAAPALQALYYTYAFFSGKEEAVLPRAWFGVEAQTIEEALFLASVFGYLFAAYRYLRFRARQLGGQELRSEFWKVRLLRSSQRVLVVLLVFNFTFVAFNYLSTQAQGYGLLHYRSFYATTSLSFGLILAYLLRGVAYRQHFSAQIPQAVLNDVSPQPAERLRALVQTGGGYLDPDLHRVRIARAVDVDPNELDDLSRELQPGAAGLDAYVRGLRLAEVKRLRAMGLGVREAALDAGFAGRTALLRAYRGRHH